jgi:hypothetical protein
MAGARVVHWNGKDIPDELRELPAGTYVLEPVERTPLCCAAAAKKWTRSFHAAFARANASDTSSVGVRTLGPGVRSGDVV